MVVWLACNSWPWRQAPSCCIKQGLRGVLASAAQAVLQGWLQAHSCALIRGGLSKPWLLGLVHSERFGVSFDL